VARFFAVQGVDRAMALAAQAFTALVPLLIVYTAVVPRPQGRDFADTLVARFELSGASAASVQEAFASTASVEDGVTGLGLVLIVVSATSFTRGMQRLYEGAYMLPARGMRGTRSGLAWLALVAVFLVFRPVLAGLFDGSAARIVVSLVLAAALWTMTPYVLLGRRLRWTRVLPSGLLAATGMTALGVSSAIWLPRTIATSAEQYGVIGVAFALLSWIVAATFILVGSATGGAIAVERFAGERRP
jgi:membrane protein